MKTIRRCVGGCIYALVILTLLSPRLGAVDLLKRYPTPLTAGDPSPERARFWEIQEGDIFRLSRFQLEVAKLRVEAGPADVGIGHCSDGAVWALVLPREGGRLTSPASSQEEKVALIWLRFHPRQIAQLFPEDTVTGGGATNLLLQMRMIAGMRINSSWQANAKAMIPEPKDLTVDVDTQGGPRRFFVVDTATPKVNYVDAFEKRGVKPTPTITPELAGKTFDTLWEAFDREYAMFVLRPEVDWSALREQYRPQALAAKSAYDLAGACAAMLQSLRDLHVWLTVAGIHVPVFNRPRSANANPGATHAIIGPLNQAGRNVAWAVTPDKIGYLAIYGWSDREVPKQCHEALEEMRDTRGLIVDVRLNGGGNEDLAREVAGRFLSRKFVYAYSQYRNGPQHTNLTAKMERVVNPGGPWRYNRPVVLLIGQKCMSSNESFVGMMSGDPDLTTMGDHTCGSSGNPRIVPLPLDMTVSVPRWIDYLPDGTPLDERGFQPQVLFKSEPGAFEGKRDDLLSAALERLRRAPLPEKPIQGPRFLGEGANGPANLRRSPEELPDYSAEVKEEAADPARPKVISIFPAPDAQAVNPATELRIRFDRPMDPFALQLTWESGGYLDCEFPRYDPDKHVFSLPVRLAPGALHQVVVNKPWSFMGDNFREARKLSRLEGFQTPDRQLAGLFVWRFQTAGAPVASGTNAPKATRVFPPAGSEVSLLTFVEIQFDQAMKPPQEAFPYLITSKRASEQPKMIRHAEYDAGTRTFRVPILLPPGSNWVFTLAGLRGTNGMLAEPVTLEYKSTNSEWSEADRARIKAATSEPKLLDLLESMKQKRSQLTSLAERVQTLHLEQEDGMYVELKGESATFCWQEPGRFYGDVSSIMKTAAFRIGCDGTNWWWHYAGEKKDQLKICPVGEMHMRDISICDPFWLLRMPPVAVAAELGLIYSGMSKVGGTEMHELEAWKVERWGGQTTVGDFTQWHIDPQTLRPVEVTKCHPYGGTWRARFCYDSANQLLSPDRFAPPKLEGVSPSPLQPLEEGYTNRFIKMHDGSSGRMSLRWGIMGPKGRNSGGLN